MIRVTLFGVFTPRLAMSARAKARLLPAPSRARSGMSLTIGRNSRERRRGANRCGEVADRLRVFDHGCRIAREHDATTSSESPDMLLQCRTIATDCFPLFERGLPRTSYGFGGSPYC